MHRATLIAMLAICFTQTASATACIAPSATDPRYVALLPGYVACLHDEQAEEIARLSQLNAELSFQVVELQNDVRGLGAQNEFLLGLIDKLESQTSNAQHAR